MVTHRFGQFLVTNGVIDEEAVIEAMNIQMKQKIPIGQIALKEKILDVSQVYRVINEQIISPKLFGIIAIDLGYLNEKGLNKLLAIQRESLPRIGEILVKINKIDKETCSSMLEKFHKIISK